MDRHAQTTKAPDGRTLMFAEWGDLDGPPVFQLHGTPGSRLNRHPDEDLVRSTGAHVVTYDRAGCGGSDRNPGRRVVDCVGDVGAIADALGLDRFAVWGGSGGGPHALAVAALLGDRVTRAMSVVGVAPYDAMGEMWLEGMDPENVKEFGWALQGEEVLVPELEQLAADFLSKAAADPSSMLADFDLSDADRAVLAQGTYARMLVESTQESCRNGVFGWADDDLAFTLPWGFDPSAITVPLQIWYGASDVLVPPSHGEWLAKHIPGSEVRISETGHLGDPDKDTIERLGWLTETA